MGTDKRKFYFIARLDRFYCFKHQFNIVKSCDIKSVCFSDHSIVIFTGFIANIKSKSAYWHFNVSLLEDNFFKEVFSEFWKTFKVKTKLYTSIQQWWDCWKIKIQQLCQQYTFNVSRDVVRSLEELEVEIVKLQSLVDSTRNPRWFDAFRYSSAGSVDSFTLSKCRANGFPY